MSPLKTAVPGLTNRFTHTRNCRRCIHLALSRKLFFHPAIIPTARLSHGVQERQQCLHSSAHVSAAPKSKERGPASKEDTQTDFGAMNVLGNTPAPTTAIDACMEDGFALNSGMRVTGAGVMLVAGEAFAWRPWIRQGKEGSTIGAGGLGDDSKGTRSEGDKVQNGRGQVDIDRHAWGVLDLVWPKPDLLVVGTGPKIMPLSAETKRHISEMGVRVEVQDTRNAAAQFNLLATERGVQQIAAALIPIGWREGR